MTRDQSMVLTELSVLASPQIFPEHDLWLLLGCWVVLVHPFLDFITFCGC